MTSSAKRASRAASLPEEPTAQEWAAASTPSRAAEAAASPAAPPSPSAACQAEAADVEAEASLRPTRTTSLPNCSVPSAAAEEEGSLRPGVREAAGQKQEGTRSREWEAWAAWAAAAADSREGSAWTSTLTRTTTLAAGARQSRLLLPKSVRARQSWTGLLVQRLIAMFELAVKPLPVALEDLYKGTTKKLRVTKKRMNGQEEANTLEGWSAFPTAYYLRTSDADFLSSPAVAIKPGWKAGTKIRFAKAGNEMPGGSQDIVFLLEEKPHATFKRDGDDLVYHFKVPLVDALSGPPGGGSVAKSLTHLDGRTINFNVPYPRGGGNPLKPGQEIRIAGEGMPITRKTATKPKGDLVVKLDIIFPDRISAAQAEGIRKVLG